MLTEISTFWSKAERQTRLLVIILTTFAIGVFFLGYGTRLSIEYLSLQWIPPIQILVDDLYANVAAEAMSILVTVLILDRLNERREARRELGRRKRDLIRLLGSRDNSIATEAARELNELGWLTDGTLKYATLRKANLGEADLLKANLQEAQLHSANLQGADLGEANLQGADLGEANLQKADLFSANLQETNLSFANLWKANLWKANLQGADLMDTNLGGANLYLANLQEADLYSAYLQEAIVTPEQLRMVKSLRGAILPDKTQLPNDETWNQAFEDWSKTQKLE